MAGPQQTAEVAGRGNVSSNRHADAGHASSLPKRKVLIIEDEKDIRDLVRYHLETEGFTVLEASDGEVSLHLAATERPALIILDLMLPGLSGLEVCRTLRAQDKLATVPILMLTARAAEVDKVLGLEMGADDYMTKPFSPRELVARIKAVLRRTYGSPADSRTRCMSVAGYRSITIPTKCSSMAIRSNWGCASLNCLNFSFSPPTAFSAGPNP